MKHVSSAAQVSRILNDGHQRRFLFHAPPDPHPTVAGTQHHDYVITMATRLEVFTVTNFVDITGCTCSRIITDIWSERTMEATFINLCYNIIVVASQIYSGRILTASVDRNSAITSLKWKLSQADNAEKVKPCCLLFNYFTAVLHVLL